MLGVTGHGKRDEMGLKLVSMRCFCFYLKPVNVQPGFSSRNLCLRSSAAVGRSFGLLCSENGPVRGNVVAVQKMGERTQQSTAVGSHPQRRPTPRRRAPAELRVRRPALDKTKHQHDPAQKLSCCAYLEHDRNNVLLVPRSPAGPHLEHDTA